ncbi:hypothetical protein ABK040_003148 [Willaertia magna]
MKTILTFLLVLCFLTLVIKAEDTIYAVWNKLDEHSSAVGSQFGIVPFDENKGTINIGNPIIGLRPQQASFIDLKNGIYYFVGFNKNSSSILTGLDLKDGQIKKQIMLKDVDIVDTVYASYLDKDGSAIVFSGKSIGFNDHYDYFFFRLNLTDGSSKPIRTIPNNKKYRIASWGLNPVEDYIYLQVALPDPNNRIGVYQFFNFLIDLKTSNVTGPNKIESQNFGMAARLGYDPVTNNLLGLGFYDLDKNFDIIPHLITYNTKTKEKMVAETLGYGVSFNSGQAFSSKSGYLYCVVKNSFKSEVLWKINYRNPKQTRRMDSFNIVNFEIVQ